MKILALVRGTVRELASKAVLYVLAGISTLILLVAVLAIGATSSDAGMTITFFGNPAGPPVPQETLSTMAGALEASFAGGLFFGVVVFGIFGTAGVIPDALEKGTVDIYLSKPVARWQLLAGKYLGSVAVIFINIVYFIAGLWLVVGLKTGVWNTYFLLSALLMTYAFACLYAIVAFLGVLSRNTAIGIIGALAYLVLIALPLSGWHTALSLEPDYNVKRGFADGLYYLLPQIPAMESGTMNVIAGEGPPIGPYVQSFLSATALLCGAGWILHKRDF